MSCHNCGKNDLAHDDTTALLICRSCGAAQPYVDFQHSTFDSSGPIGSTHRLGTAGDSTVYTYKQNKIYNAQKVVSDILDKLGLESRVRDVNIMISKITEGEYGLGNWFPVFVGACAYVYARNDGKMLPLSMTIVAGCVGCDVHELGRMVGRVVEFCELKLPEFDIVGLYDSTVRNYGFGKGVTERMLKQGVFLIQCLVKWFVTTGRRPGPVVVAVFVFVAKMNGQEVLMEEVAEKLCVAVHTCRLRYKEVLERLVEVARDNLPWGKDVTVKNIAKNASFVIQFMEAKSMCKRGRERRGSLEELVGPDLEELVGECLENEVSYRTVNNDSSSTYFEARHSLAWNIKDLEKLKISHECLSTIYLKYLDEVSELKSTSEKIQGNRKRRGVDSLVETDHWMGKSELSEKLFLEQILQKDVGLDALPPSFVTGCLVYQERREKIKAAKLRIEKIRRPPISNLSCGKDDLCHSECVKPSKKRSKLQVDIEWEDFVIETLLLHHVKEEEIEKGYYNSLLDLHVFNSQAIL